MGNSRVTRISAFYPYFLVLIVSALVYLPYAFQLGFYRDDWYYIADGYFGGAEIFHAMFEIDRPARGYLFEALFRLFSVNAIYYHLLMWVWRSSAGIFCYALFSSIWPKQVGRNLAITLLFVLYPGFLWWVSGVEYQPMLLSLAAHMASFWFTILFIKSRQRWRKTVFFLLSLVSGWISLWLVDYAIGMELFRLVCIYFYFQAATNSTDIKALWKPVLINGLASLPIMAGFLFWRLFSFSGTRPETDVAMHLGRALQNPVQSLVDWAVSFFRSFYSVLFHAWHTSFAGNFFALSSAQKAIAILLTGMVVTVIILAGKRMKPRGEDFSTEWAKAAILGGLIGLLGGAIPIVGMGRTILIDAFSHYALPVSICAVLVILGCLAFIQPAKVRSFVLVLLMALAAISIHSHALNVINEEQKILGFWKQFSQRVPRLRVGTAVLVNFPSVHYGEDFDVVWAPLNLVYLSRDEVVITDNAIWFPYTGAKINPDTMKHVLMGDVQNMSYRTQTLMVDFSSLLVVSQPSRHSCVHVMDARWPRLSAQDTDQILLASTHSRIENVLLASSSPDLISEIFGEMPGKNWCSFYYQAEKEVQAGNWENVLGVWEEARGQGFEPSDSIEWMPFLQAALVSGNLDVIEEIAGRVEADVFFRYQACALVSYMEAAGYQVTQFAKELSQYSFCR